MRITLQNTSISLIESHRAYFESNRTNLSQATLKGYNERYLSLIKYGLYDELPMDKINTNVINQFINNMENLKPSTKQNILNYLKILLNYCLENEYIDKMPRFKAIRNAQTRSSTLDDKSITKLLEPVKEPNFVLYRDWVIVNFMLATGLRSRNIRIAKVEHLDLDKHTLYVPTSKNGRAYTVYLSDSIQAILRAYINKAQLTKEMPLFPTVWGKELTTGALHNSLKKYFKSRDVDTHPHQLREVYASRLASANVPLNVIRDLLFHSDVKTTNKYLKSLDSELQTVSREVDVLSDFQPKKRTRITMR